MTDTTISLGRLPLLFVDDAGLAQIDGLSRTVHVARTLAEPVVAPEADRPGERVYIYGSVYRDAEGLQMWYQRITSAQRGTDWVCLARSTDGVSWRSEKVGVIEGAAYDSAVFKTHSPSILHDPFDTNPKRRYKLVGAVKEDGKNGYMAAWSPDGVHWTSHPGNPILSSSDTVTMTQHPATGEYLVYHKRPGKVGDVHRRTVWLSRSSDFETWSEPLMVFAADEADDQWGGRTDVYNMSVMPHAAGFIGFPTMFRIIRLRDKSLIAAGQSNADGPIDVQLASSCDGVAWRRTWPRVNVIPRGEPGAFDAGLILGTSSTLVDMGDETWLYYTALNTGHGAPMEAKRMTIGRAAWRRDGFVSLDADPVGGTLLTRPLRLTGEGLFVNANVSRGLLRLGLHAPDGTAIAGFGVDDCQPIQGNGTRMRVRWKAGDVPAKGLPVQVRVELACGRLYALAGEAVG